MGWIATLRNRRYRRRYARYMEHEHRKIDELAASPIWVCGRCGKRQGSEGRLVRKYFEDRPYGAWPRADFVAMTCWDCGESILKVVKREGDE